MSTRIPHPTTVIDLGAKEAADAEPVTRGAFLVGMKSIAQRFDKLDGKLEDIRAQVDGAELYAMRARGDARRAEEAADRAMHLSAGDVARIAEAVRPVVRGPIVKAGRQGVARGIGGALATLSIGAMAAFYKDPVAFVEAIDRLKQIFGGT